MLPWPHSDVEPAEAFDHPENHRRIEPKRDPDWLGFPISKSLAGCAGYRYAWYPPPLPDPPAPA